MDLWSSLALFLEKIVKSNPNESIDPRQKVLSSRKVNDLMSNQYFLGHLVVIYDCIYTIICYCSDYWKGMVVLYVTAFLTGYAIF
jgi:hypothetical protein